MNKKIKLENEKKQEEFKCRLNAFKKNRKCNIEKCNSNAINSHILWKEGLLRKISNDSHLYEVNSLNYSTRLHFKKKGLKEVLSFPGFCGYHDNLIFKEIEKDNFDYKILNNQILISLRSVIFESIKKEQVIDWFNCLIEKKLLPFPDQKEMLKISIKGHKAGIRDLNFIISELNQEYYRPNGRFVFKYYELDQIPIVCSTIFNTDDLNITEFDYEPIDYDNPKPLNWLIFNLFPYLNKSVIIVGFHINNLTNLNITNKIGCYNKEELQYLISNILVERSENWACSTDFFNSNIQHRENEILEQFEKIPNLFNGGINKNSINLFNIK